MADETYERDNLIAGDFPRVARHETILDGQTLVRGSLLGRITASGKYILSLAAAGDGSEVPVAIAAEAITTSGADGVANLYFTGEFNQDQITYGTGHDADSVRDGLDGRSIFLKKSHKQSVA